MIVKLCKKSVVIEDVNQHECVELENYDVLNRCIPAGSSLYALDIKCSGKYPIMIRSNNLVVIDKR
jgi:hypothetical protein